MDHPHASHWGAYVAETEGGRLSGVKPFARDANPSPITRAVPDAVYHPLRIAQPMVRAGYLADGPGAARRGGERFVPVSWERALELVAGELERVRRDHGNASIFGGSAGWGSAGRVHNTKAALKRFLNLIGGFTDQTLTYSFGAGQVVLPHVLGKDAMALRCPGPWSAVIRETKLMVMFGGVPLKNTQVDNAGTGDHPVADILTEAKRAGIAFVNVGPVRDEGADFLEADWIKLRPNTDTAMLMGLAHTLAAEGLADRDFLANCTVGYERYLAYLMGEGDGIAKDADWAGRITGVDPARIRELARAMAGQRTMLNLAWSIQRAHHGEQPYWAAIALAAMLGQIGLPGGGVGFGYTATAGFGSATVPVTLPAISQGTNPVGPPIPCARVGDMLLNPGASIAFNGGTVRYPDIKLIYWVGGNPFHHQQDINKFLTGWSRAETIIVHEPWWTPVAKFADIVLPATTTLERNDLTAGAGDRYILAMHQAIAPVGEARNDRDIIGALAERFGVADAFTEGRDEMGWVRHIYDQACERYGAAGFALPAFETFWREGHVCLPEPTERIAMAGLRADPKAHPLKTPSGRIELFSETVAGFGYDEAPGHPVWNPPEEWLGDEKAARWPLHLISPQPGHRLHSQLDMGPVSRAAKVAGREPVWINPEDAAARGIADGDVVRLFNGRGACLAGAVVTDRIMPGVVQLCSGAWYDPETPGEIGTLDKHGNPNMLTLDRGTSRLAQCCAAVTTLTELARWDGPAPPVTAFDPPEILDLDVSGIGSLRG